MVLFSKEGVELSKTNVFKDLLSEFIKSKCDKYNYDYLDFEMKKDGKIVVTLLIELPDGYDGIYLEEVKTILIK